MRVIVTRPEREARAWVEALVERGLDALALPLIDIRPVSDPADMLAVWHRLGDYAALMFVSGIAVEHFFAVKTLVHRSSDAVGRKTRFWGPGPGTAAALRRHGVDASLIDAPPLDRGQFDSEALWDVVQTQVQAGDRILIVRGGDDAQDQAATQGAATAGYGRDWLARRLLQAGALVEFVLAYRRAAPVLSTAQSTTLQDAANDGSIWLFTSALAVANLRACSPRQSWADASAIATHPRIADAARAAGFGVVWESRPGVSEVVASIESIR